MMGVFSENQPAYAEHRIATFPLGYVKKPLVRNYQRMGLPASAKLAERFHSADGLGFMTNARTRVSVLDIDTTDERVLADAMSVHGITPLIGRTASGKFHALYRHNGEFRKIRPFGDLPIDLLEIGGYVVAVPSRFEQGAYAFIEGCLDDIDQLPAMRGLDPAMYRPRLPAAVVTARPKAQETSDNRPVSEGVRNTTLWRFCMKQLSISDLDIDAIVKAAIIRNCTFSPPLPENEVVQVAASAWGLTAAGRNWFGKGGRVFTSHAEVDELLNKFPDAFMLLTKLRRHNWGQDFTVANSMSADMPGKWSRQRFAAARSELERRGKIRCVRKANGIDGSALFAWGNGRG